MDTTLLIKTNKTMPVLARHFILLVCSLCLSTLAIAEQHAIIVSSSNNNHHRSLVDNILLDFNKINITIETVDIKKISKISASNNLIISLGHRAATLVDRMEIPNPKLRVFTDTSPHTDPEQTSKSHLSMTQPVCQQFLLAKSINPKWKVVSILLSTRNNPLTHKLSSCAKQHKLELNTIILNKYVNIIDALNTSLVNSDVLLALPDSEIYNTRTIKSILLTTYRHRVPIIGFSENFVRAGALAAMHSSTKQLSQQITELIQKHYNGENIDKHIYPEYFDVITNKNVAKSLSINIPDKKELLEKLRIYNDE